jgi:hypothetical protein
MPEAHHAATPPGEHVLEAFSVDGALEALSVGPHGTWRIGDVVLKPADISEEQLTGRRRFTNASG